jgi:hypothetical protein
VRQLRIRDGLWNPCQGTTLPKSSKMIRETKKAMVESATEIGCRGAEYETGVVQGEMGIRLREE